MAYLDIFAPLLAMAPIYVPIAVMWIVFKQRERRARRYGMRHPLAGADLLRPAGYSVSNAMDDERWKLIEIFLTGFVASIVFILVLNAAHRISFLSMPRGIAVATVVAGAMLIRPVMRLPKVIRKLRDLRLGMEGEMATAEELNRLMLRGFRVFHDMQADGFNIDHIVIGPTGVFAIETKTRVKRKTGKDETYFKAVFDGNSLRLADRKEDQALEQARRQAKWLSRWLGKCVGEPVRVRPGLALPGWYVDLKAKCDVVIFTPRQADHTFPAMRDSDRLSDEAIRRISHQVEQACRDIKPRTALL